MASLLRTLSLSARALVPKSVMGAFAIRGPSSMLRATPSLFDSNATSLMAPTSGAMGAVAQQTRGMKVQSSVKKRCEHCKVRIRSKLGYWGDLG